MKKQNIIRQETDQKKDDLQNNNPIKSFANFISHKLRPVRKIESREFARFAVDANPSLNAKLINENSISFDALILDESESGFRILIRGKITGNKFNLTIKNNADEKKYEVKIVWQDVVDKNGTEFVVLGLSF